MIISNEHGYSLTPKCGYRRSSNGIRRCLEDVYDMPAIVLIKENVILYSAERTARFTVLYSDIDGLRRRPRKTFDAAMSVLQMQLEDMPDSVGLPRMWRNGARGFCHGALRRAGRFDVTLLIQPPSKQGMAQILRRHLAVSHDPELESVITPSAERPVGTGGAEATGLARAALSHARATGAELAQALLAEMDKRLPGRAEHIDRRIAIHESGYAVVGMLSGLPAPSPCASTARAAAQSRRCRLCTATKPHWPKSERCLVAAQWRRLCSEMSRTGQALGQKATSPSPPIWP
jgi:hypothetical protein